jgi:hypothetical protein
VFQRPIPTGAQDIGTWQSIFQLVSVLSVVTNAGLICFTMNVLDGEASPAGRVWVFVGFQWILIAIQFYVQAVIPDVPEEVEIQISRNEVINEKLIEKINDEESTPISEAMKVVTEPLGEGSHPEGFFVQMRKLLTDEEEGATSQLKGFEKRVEATSLMAVETLEYHSGGVANPTANPMASYR